MYIDKMKKHLFFICMAAVSVFSSCSSDETADAETDIPIGFSEVPIRLSTGASTRASIESDENGLFEVDGIGIYALAREVMDVNPGPLPITWGNEAEGTKTYAVLLDNVEANAVKDIEHTITNIVFADGKQYYYPMGNWYRYGFYGYYPRTEDIIATDTSRIALITISGKEDVIYGKAVSDEEFAYSARYFRQTENLSKVPSMQFDHKLMRITFSAVPGADVEDGDTYVNAQNMAIKSIKVLGVPTQGELMLANSVNPSIEGDLTFEWSDTGAMQDLELLDTGDQPLNYENYFMEVNEGAPVEKTVGQGIMLPVPEADGDYKYRVAVTLQDKSGAVYECEYPQELTLSGGSVFAAGKSYNVRMKINGPKEITLSAKLTKWEIDENGLGDLEF